MSTSVKWQVGIIGAIVVALLILISAPVLAQGFGVSPSEVTVSNMPPGGKADFELTIYNNDDVARVFTPLVYNPPEADRRAGKQGFPDNSWISFSPEQVDIAANSQGQLSVTVTVPDEYEWHGQDWEVWLGVTTEAQGLFAIIVYVRLYVSTTPSSGTNWALIVGVIAGVTVLACAGWYARKMIGQK
jgi:hypothetical protein